MNAPRPAFTALAGVTDFVALADAIGRRDVRAVRKLLHAESVERGRSEDQRSDSPSAAVVAESATSSG